MSLQQKKSIEKKKFVATNDQLCLDNIQLVDENGYLVAEIVELKHLTYTYTAMHRSDYSMPASVEYFLLS